MLLIKFIFNLIFIAIKFISMINQKPSPIGIILNNINDYKCANLVLVIVLNILIIFQVPYKAVYYDKISSLLAYYIDLKLMSSQ